MGKDREDCEPLNQTLTSFYNNCRQARDQEKWAPVFRPDRAPNKGFRSLQVKSEPEVIEIQ
jgi:hypothetical protein